MPFYRIRTPPVPEYVKIADTVQFEEGMEATLYVFPTSAPPQPVTDEMLYPIEGVAVHVNGEPAAAEAGQLRVPLPAAPVFKPGLVMPPAV